MAPRPGQCCPAVEAVPTCAATRGCPILTGEVHVGVQIPAGPEACVDARCGPVMLVEKWAMYLVGVLPND
jgi:hypothetical protein